MKKAFLSLAQAVLLLFAVCGQAVAADDFVDKINVQAYGAGQRVIYELNVGSFTSEGTFDAAKKRLLELKKTGVDIVWLMPIYPRGGGIDSPYAATDFREVNPAYGSVSDLKAFVEEAHSLGMEVWLDWVPNHTATDAKWVTSNPEYYTKDSDGQMIHPNNYGDVYELDYSNAGLVNAMNDCLKFWIDQADVDGYRCDYVSSPTIPASYWQNTISMLKNYKSGKTITMLAEADISDVTKLKGVGFDYDYAWGFHEDKLQQFGATGQYANPLKLYASEFVKASSELGVGRMVYLTNHDQNYNYLNKHTLTQKYGSNKYLLRVLTYTLYGMPMIYNGEETGGDQKLDYFKDTKIDWTASDPKMLNTLRTLAAIKHTQAALHDGAKESDNPSVNFLETNNKQYILAYSRQSGNSEVIVLLNTSTSKQDVTVDGINGTYSLWLNSETIADKVSRKSVTFNGKLSVSIPAKGYLVYVKGYYTDEEGSNQETAIGAIKGDNTGGQCYDICGFPVNKPDRGFYIYNGRKYMAAF